MDGAVPPPGESYEDLARLMDLHLLRPEMTEDGLARGCRIAREYGMRAVVVRPSDADSAGRFLGLGVVSLASTAGFPDGTWSTPAKLYEGRDLLRRGIREIEIVVHPGKLISRQFQHVETELAQMSQSCAEQEASLTVVLRNDLLPEPDLKIIATKIARRIGAAYVSVFPIPADLELVRPLLRGTVGLKATRVNTLDEALAARQAGCTRLGTGRGAEILDEWRARLSSAVESTAPGPLS